MRTRLQGPWWYTYIYSALMISFGFLGLPVWLLILWRIPKLRVGLRQKLGFRPFVINHSFPTSVELTSTQTVWVHCVSVGELNAAAPLIDALILQYSVVLTTATATAQDLAHRRFPQLTVAYCPLDFPWAVQRALREIRPSALLILETEIWPNLFMLTSRHASVFMVNARLSDRSFKRYSQFKCFLQPVLACVTRILAQTRDDVDRFRALGASALETCGNLKFDLVAPVITQPWQPDTGGLPILVFASTHEGEEKRLIPVIQASTQQGVCCVLAPRHPERGAIVRDTLIQAGLPSEQRSVLTGLPQTLNPGRVLILDTIGELMTVYAVAQLAVMGGSWIPFGGHNPLEPVIMNCPVILGPYMDNFAEMTAQLLTVEGCQQLDRLDELAPAIQHHLADRANGLAAVKRAQAMIHSSSGTTQRILQLLQIELADKP